MINNEHVFAVILAGGGGTRLWPKSRDKNPKQFLKLGSKKTMLQLTADRMSKIVPWEKIIVVTTKKYYDKVKLQLPDVKKENIITEPQRRDTALAMLVGALYAKSKDPNAIVLNAASDHTVTNEREYQKVMKAAVKVVSGSDKLVCVGITPTHPHTGLGYVRIGKEISQPAYKLPLFNVISFTEKPNEAVARAYLATGNYFWNANMYVWSAESIQNAFEKYMPDMFNLTKELEKLSSRAFHKNLNYIYKDADSIAIDYAISERATNLVLLPGDFGWNDIGDWNVVYKLSKKNHKTNVVVGDYNESEVVSIKSRKNMIYTYDKLIALYGVNDMVIIDTDKVLLICPRNESQKVKELVKRLERDNQKKYL